MRVSFDDLISVERHFARSAMSCLPEGIPPPVDVAIAAELIQLVETEADAALAEERQPQIGKYRVAQRVGFGTFAGVYRAHDMMLDRSVALKVYREAGTGPAIDEARRIAKLRHPNVVSVYDVVLDAVAPVMVLEYCDTDLKRHIERQEWSTHDIYALIGDTAEGLKHLTQRRISHGDLKPSNILRGDNRWKLADFGLARSYESAAADRRGGTLLYLAPERVFTDSGPSGPADVWALGIVLYEIMFQKWPFNREQAGANEFALRKTIYRAQIAWPTVSGGFEHLKRITTACLQPDPQKRPTPDHLLDAVSDFRQVSEAQSTVDRVFATLVKTRPTPFPRPRSLPPNETGELPEPSLEQLSELQSEPWFQFDSASTAAREWWNKFSAAYTNKPGVVYRLLLELRERNATLTEMFLAYVYSRSDNIKTTLYYLEFARAKASERPAETPVQSPRAESVLKKLKDRHPENSTSAAELLATEGKTPETPSPDSAPCRTDAATTNEYSALKAAVDPQLLHPGQNNDTSVSSNVIASRVTRYTLAHLPPGVPSVKDRYDEVFGIEMEGWCYGVANFPGEMFPGLIRRVIKELTLSFREAIEHFHAFDIVAVANAFAEAASNVISAKEIALSIMSCLPCDGAVDDNSRLIVRAMLEHVERVYGPIVATGPRLPERQGPFYRGSTRPNDA